MRVRSASILTVAVLSLAAGAVRAQDAAICTRCHATEASVAAFEGGHAPSVDCLSCHGDRRPGVFGPGHRALPTSCTGHHTTDVETHPPPAKPLGTARLRRTCLRCHDPHGSPNAHLVRSAIFVRGRFRPIAFPASTPMFVDPAKPGHGLCETCHRKTDFYRANGTGQPHFTGDCTLCHDHVAGFRPVASDANCPVCHAAEAAALAGSSLHHDRFAGTCSACHAEVNPEPGPGHRAVSACADCHSAARVMTHVPPGAPQACVACHDPHGSENIRLIRDVVHTPQGLDRPVRFDSLAGRADGSFASASAPGTGLCEVCHSRTQFYRGDGTGASHFTTQCIVCHLHSTGFLPG